MSKTASQTRSTSCTAAWFVKHDCRHIPYVFKVLNYLYCSTDLLWLIIIDMHVYLQSTKLSMVMLYCQLVHCPSVYFIENRSSSLLSYW